MLRAVGRGVERLTQGFPRTGIVGFAGLDAGGAHAGRVDAGRVEAGRDEVGGIELELAIDLVDDARFLGWDVICLGRTAAGESFDRGALRQRLALTRDGIPTFAERAVLHGGAPLLTSPVGLQGNPVFGTFLAAAPVVTHAMLESCRQVLPMTGEGAVTRLPGVLIARYRGASAAAARHYFVELWRKLRPVLAHRAAVPPRIWAT